LEIGKRGKFHKLEEQYPTVEDLGPTLRNRKTNRRHDTFTQKCDAFMRHDWSSNLL